MESVGIQRGQGAHFLELVRAAANGELIVLTDYGKPLAEITSIEGEGANRTAPRNSGRLSWLFRITLMSISSSTSIKHGKCL